MDLNEIIHQPVRLRIMSALCILAEGERVDFSILRNHLNVTDGNLGAHLRKLAAERYVEITKSFVDLKPRTRIQATVSGRLAFLEHVRALEEIVRGPAALTRPSD